MKTVYPEADSLTSSERSEADTEITTGDDWGARFANV